jgi:PleD family two-component response regulator
MPKKILVVDDSKTALMMEREIVERRTTYQCVTASATGAARFGFDGCGNAPHEWV